MLRDSFASQYLRYSLPASASNSHNKCYTENTCCFQIQFSSLQWKWLFLAHFLFRPAVPEVGRWSAMLPGKGVKVFPYSTPCSQSTHGGSRDFLSQGCVGSCENACTRLVPPGLRSAPALQANCYHLSLSFYFRRCHISNGS